MQRFFDVIFSFVAILFLSPLLIPIVCILRFTGESEIFYTQKRVGLEGKTFGLLKFATMLKDSPNIGAGDITVADDPRVLPLGKFLRKTKINELPQLINILKGDMSIVGPRPMVVGTYQKYGDAGKEVYSIRPGLTGLGSIIFSNEERFFHNKSDPMEFYQKVIIPYKIQIELWYLNHKSIGLYFQIIFLTAWAIISPKTKIYRSMFDKLPELPDELREV